MHPSPYPRYHWVAAVDGLAPEGADDLTGLGHCLDHVALELPATQRHWNTRMYRLMSGVRDAGITVGQGIP